MEIYEYRGVRGLVYAPVTKDDSTGFTTGTVKALAGVAEISKSTDSSNEAHFYDNIPAVIVSSTGSDTITINTSAIPYDALAEITGQYYDATTGMYVEKERTPGYWALGYITKTTSGDEVFVWRLKGTFTVPDQVNSTENDGTDANGQEITYTGISTTFKFTKTNSPAKAVNVDTGKDLADVTNFFNAVQTPDTVQAKVVTPSVSINEATPSVEKDATTTLTATTVPAGQTVAWSTTDTTYINVGASTGVVTGVAVGSGVVTATITVDGQTYTDTVTVTVTDPEA